MHFYSETCADILGDNISDGSGIEMTKINTINTSLLVAVTVTLNNKETQ